MNTSPDAEAALSIEDILPIIDAVVAQMSRHLPPHVPVQDLTSAGKLALMEILADAGGTPCLDRGYVVCRVRGAVLDEMRRLDPLSRHARSQVRRVRQSVSELESELNRVPTDKEVAARTGFAESEIGRISRLGIAAEALSADNHESVGSAVRSLPDLQSPSPADAAEDRDTLSVIRGAIERLTTSQCSVLQAYYFNGFTLQQIAAQMGISVVRVHQLKAAAEASLRGNTTLMDAWRGSR